MRTLYIALAAALACGAAAAPAAAQTAADSAAIRAVVLDYVEGWYAGDGERMARAVHPELTKRIARPGSEGRAVLRNMTADELVSATSGGGGRHTPAEERQRDVEILDVFGNAASARATMSGWVDYMHLARMDGRWVIVNVLWEMKPRG